LRELAFTVLIALASYRAWALIALDTITKPIRKRLLKADSWLDLWWRCPWCAGTWITAAITILTDQLADGGVASPVLVFGAATALTALLGGNDSRLMESDDDVG